MAEIYVVMHLECEPSDTPHWCLYTTDNDDEELIFEALGISGSFFRYTCRSVRMETSTSEKQQVHIGRIEVDVWHEIPNLFAGVPVSTQAGWNCQNWVMETIETLKEKKFLEQDDSALSFVQERYQKKRYEY